MNSRSHRVQVMVLAAAVVLLAAGLFWTILHRKRDMAALLALARRDYPDVPRIQVADLKAWLKDPTRSQPQLFDVRTPEEYAVSCLPGARRVDPNIRIRAMRKLMDTNRPAVFYCSLGYRSSALVAALQDARITNAVNLEGSIFAWANSGLPLEEPSTRKPTQLVHPFSASYIPLLKSGHAADVPLLESARNEIAARQRLRMFFSFGLLVLFLAWETFAPMYRWFESRTQERWEHGLRNVILGLINTILIASVFVQTWLWASYLAQDHRIGLLNWLQPPAWARAVIALFLLDGWMYAWHRLNHGLPFLWRFHRVHHSERHLDVTSATRFHLGEIAASAIIRVPLIFLFGIHFAELAIYETILFAVVQFHHANIRLPAGVERFLSLIIVTPNIHRVHHSRLRPETDSNFASLLSFWDRLFHTRKTADPAKIQLGLDEFGDDRQTLRGMLRTPLD